MQPRFGAMLPFSTRLVRAVGLLAGAFTLVGCLNNDGAEPPEGELNFPIAIALSQPVDGESEFLFVANSNFDIRYNTGTVQTYALDRFVECFARCRPEDDCVVVDPLRERDDPAPLEEEPCPGVRVAEVRTDSFASGLAVASDNGRLFVPMRSTANVTVIEVEPATGLLSCGGAPGTRHRCNETYARGVRQVGSARDIRLPSDPVGIHAGPLDALLPGAPGDFLLIAHRAGSVSLFLDRPEGERLFPNLIHVVSELPPDLIGITFEPATQLAWMPSTTQAVVSRVGIALDADAASLERSFLFDAGSLGLRGIDTAGRPDLRAITFDPRPEVPFAYVLSRSPQSVITADLARSTAGFFEPVDVLDVCLGPSKMAVREVAEGIGGQSLLLGLVSCFDSRELYVLDLERRQLVGVVRGFSGPFEVVVDEARRLVYVADFRASVVQAVSLDPLFACVTGGPRESEDCSPRVVGVLGRPRPVRELR